MTSDMLDEEIQEYKDGTNVEVNGVTLTIKGPVHVFKLLHYDERTGRSAKRISFIAG